MATLTYKELAMIHAFIAEGRKCNGADTPEGLVDDNMTYCNAVDLREALGWPKHVVAGVMSSLDAKGIIIDTGESPRGAKQTDWFLAEDAILEYWPDETIDNALNDLPDGRGLKIESV